MYNHMATPRKPQPRRTKPVTQGAQETTGTARDKVQIPVFVTTDVRRALKMTALELDTTVGALVEGLIRDFLASRRTK
jgi:uncharacterized membrane protein